MGQYWIPVMENKVGKRYAVCAHDFVQGLKFLENAWIGYPVVNIVMSKLYKNPMLISWVGDYTENRLVGVNKGPTGDEAYDYKYVNNTFFTHGEPAYGYSYTEDLNDEYLDKIKTQFSIDNTKKYIIVNWTKKLYLDLEEYLNYSRPENSRFSDEGVLSPLACLTASPSMDEGLGDYHKENGLNFDKIGVWSWDLISIEDKDFDDSDFKKVPIDKYYFDMVVKN